MRPLRDTNDTRNSLCSAQAACLPLCLRKGFIAPGIPVHGIVGMLQQIGTSFVYQPIGVVVVGIAVVGFFGAVRSL